MKSLQRRFYNTQEKNPTASSYICFAKAVNGQKFSRQTIGHWFYKLVDKNDYAKSEVREILLHLWNLSNNSEDVAKRG